MRLHHVQLACPPGGEDEARRFWTAVGLSEIPKPEALVRRGGCWFCSPEGAEIHVGVEEPFVPARKAHPALVVSNLAQVVRRLREAGFEVDERERETFSGYLRFHTFDAHGNRIEVLQPRPRGGSAFPTGSASSG